MRILWEAIQAVTVEMLGVAAVVWLLFGAATWSVESAGARPARDMADLSRWVKSISGRVAQAFASKSNEENERANFVSARLGHYSRTCREAVDCCVKKLAQGLSVDLSAPHKSQAISKTFHGASGSVARRATATRKSATTTWRPAPTTKSWGTL